ncbi:MAG: hypothetical protein H7240_02630 [Glaciimonas sp.]|nr:hypothetical protein [Glaciimonas sp.]
MSFLDMVMCIVQNDNLLVVGNPIEVNKLMGAIDANPGLRNDLQTLASQLKIRAGGMDRNWLEKVLKSFGDKGYQSKSSPECFNMHYGLKFLIVR